MTSASPIRALAGAILPIGQRNGLFAMLTNLAGYCDESGTALDAGVLVVGGLITSVDEWDDLHTDWFHRLSNAGLDPSKDFLHRSVFEARKRSWMQGKKENIYQDWKDAKAASVVADLTKIICERVRAVVSVSVVVDDYEAVKGGPFFVANRYNFCVLRAIAMVSRWAKTQAAEPVAYVFEDGANDAEETFKHEVNYAVGQLFSDAVYRREHRFEALAFKSKRKLPQLQAADFVVWDLRHRIRSVLRGSEEYSNSLKQIMTTLVPLVEHYDAAELKKFENYTNEKRRGSQ